MADKLLSLIDAIYAAAADPALWLDTALKIQHAIGGHSYNLVLEDLADGRISTIYTNGIAPSELARYQRDIIDRDELTGFMDKMPEGTAFNSHDLFDLPTLHSLYCYQNFYENLGYTHFNVGQFYRTEQRRGWLSIIRSQSEPLFAPNDRMLIKALLPHLKRAFRINIQLQGASLTSRVALDALEHIAAATALLNRRGQVVLHNQRAARYLCKSGVATGDVSLRLPDARANSRLHRLIAAMAQVSGPPPEDTVPFMENGIHKMALCFLWRASEQQQDWLGQAAHCIVFILSPSAEQPGANLLQQMLAISPAEVRVLQQLLNGMSAADIADTLCVSEATVRFHIRNLLHKTQTHNQTELLARVFKSISVMVQ